MSDIVLILRLQATGSILPEHSIMQKAADALEEKDRIIADLKRRIAALDSNDPSRKSDMWG